MEFATHIVAVGAFVTNAEDQVLMIKNPERGWEFPGGIVETGESLTEALIREVKEETGIDIFIQSLVGIHSNISIGLQYDGIAKTPTIVNIDFLAKAISGELTTSLESVEVGWFKKDGIMNLPSHPMIIDRLKCMLNFQGQPVYRVFAKNPYQVLDERSI